MADDGYCPNGCQHLEGLGECGMCGYSGPGVTQKEQNYVIDASEKTGRYERRPNSDREAERIMAEFESNEPGPAPVPGWRRDFDGEPERKQEPADPEIHQALSGLLTSKAETRLERYEREARESGGKLTDRVPDQERDKGLNRW